MPRSSGRRHGVRWGSGELFFVLINPNTDYIILMETGRHILHVDMDAFYASVEVKDNANKKKAVEGLEVLVGE